MEGLIYIFNPKLASTIGRMVFITFSKFRFSLKRQYNAIDYMCEKSGLIFWDYGNAFLLEVSRSSSPSTSSSENSSSSNTTKFKYPSYMQDVMGDIFSLGFGPFRWICTSGLEKDLKLSDETATKCFETILAKNNCNNPFLYTVLVLVLI